MIFRCSEDEADDIINALKKMGFSLVSRNEIRMPGVNFEIEVMTLPEDEEAHTLAKLKYGPLNDLATIKKAIIEYFRGEQ